MLSTILISFIVLFCLLRYKSVVKSGFIKLKFHLKMAVYYVILTLVAIIVIPVLLTKPKHHSNGFLRAKYPRPALYPGCGLRPTSSQAEEACVQAVKIWIFPEGTRNTKWDGKLLPFKKGAFNLAVTAQVPIIPVVYSPYYFIDKDNYVFNKGHVIVQCLEPVSTVGLTLDDVPALADRLHQTMSRCCEQLSREVLSLDSNDTGTYTKNTNNVDK